jgi:hypothetical protein
MRKNMILINPGKSVAAAILLAIFFGPFGLLYSSVLGGIVVGVGLFVVCAVIQFNQHVTPLIAILWGITPLWAVLSVNRYNKKLLKKYHKD